MTSTIEIAWRTRDGGGGRTERRFLDFVIDGVPLLSRFGGDFISPFGWCDAATQDATLDRLLRKPTERPGGRSVLYLCPECADIGCGAITVVVEGKANAIVWRDFGVQNDYEGDVDRAGFENTGPFTFDGLLYHRLLESLRPGAAESARSRNP